MAAPHLGKPCCPTGSPGRTEEDNGVNSVGDRIADLVSTKQPGHRENGLLRGSEAGAFNLPSSPGTTGKWDRDASVGVT